LIPKPYDFEPKFLGEHIRKKRLKLGLLQKEVAGRLGVSPWSILNWENGHTEPPISAIPRVLLFLEYDPFPEPRKIQDHLAAKRRTMGWTIKEAAKAVGVDPGTWGEWERGQVILYRRHRALISNLFGMPFEALDQEMTACWNRLHDRVL